MSRCRILGNHGGVKVQKTRGPAVTILPSRNVKPKPAPVGGASSRKSSSRKTRGK